MVDEMTVKGVLFQELKTAGYSPTEAWWIADEWAPQYVGYQWSGEQLAGWLYDSGLVMEIPDPDKPTGDSLTVPGAARYGINKYRAAMGRAQVMAANEAVQERIRQSQLETQGLLAAERTAEAERQGQIAQRTREMAGFIPTRAEMRAPFLQQAGGISPAFQRVAGEQLLPDIFEELGMEQKRGQWWETGIKGIAEQLLPETQQEKELMALKRADPWAQLLSQPTFLQQLETRFRGLSPAEKGVTTGRFRPRTRFI